MQPVYRGSGQEGAPLQPTGGGGRPGLWPGDGLSASFAWLGALCYTLQIYYDFSGYSDMAIGLGKMFGFHFLENFNYPYISRSITEFWRRWHISLSTWFRDYVYFPWGSRVNSKAKHIRNLFVVWLLTGVWHGANWTFLAWGLFYFVLLVLEKYGGLGRGWPVWGQMAVYLPDGELCLGAFPGGQPGGGGAVPPGHVRPRRRGWDDLTALYLRENWTVLAASVLFAGPLAPACGTGPRKGQPPAGRGLRRTGGGGVPGVGGLPDQGGTYNPFIYFNF